MTVVDLRHYIRVYDHDLEPTICGQMIDSFAALERFQRPNGRGYRPGLEDSAWIELNVSTLADTGFVASFRHRIEQTLARYNREIGLTIDVPPPSRIADLMMKRYRAGQREQFQLHFDAIYQKSDRYLVLLWYLNDMADGGETVFPQLEVSVKPMVGRLLVFPPFWMYQHEGRPPGTGNKFILSTYLLHDQPV